MIKAIFFFLKRDKSEEIEITQEEEPELFAFIYKIADEANAPRPHKVYLSNSVNAAVFYDLSILNLIFPSKKNLIIGLGLANTLNLNEFKAVLAHEFGHFTQKSMIIGRWVYIANQVAVQIIHKRDALDGFLSALSHFDLRVAWIGWILSIIIWSIRAVAETFFQLVLYTQRALSREMEFHADLVAVSLTGSDALINGLHKLGAADEAFAEALKFADEQLVKKKLVTNIYALQSNYIKQTSKVLNDPTFGAAPLLPSVDKANFRVFKEQIAHPPKMWMTHPANADREKNAKKIYIEVAPDERSTWELFKNPEVIKERITADLIKRGNLTGEPLSVDESLKIQNQKFNRKYLDSKYQGIYLNRLMFIDFSSPKEMFDETISDSQIENKLSTLYPHTLTVAIEHLKNLEEELLMLEGLNANALDTKDGVIKHRGNEIKRKDLPDAIQSVKEEIKKTREELTQHDKLCRSVHFSAAKKLGDNWSQYLLSLAEIIHFCEHSEQSVKNKVLYFHNVLAVVTADGRVSSSELSDVITAANSLHFSLEKIYKGAKDVKLNDELINRLEGKNVSDFLGEFRLNRASDSNINNFMEVVNSWIQEALNFLFSLRIAALDELLETEDKIKSLVNKNTTSINSPQSISTPNQYDLITLEGVNTTYKNLNLWDRFYSANGTIPTIARLAVASAIIGVTIAFGSGVASSNLYIYNGLPVDINVSIDGKNSVVNGNSFIETTIEDDDEINIITKTTNNELIENITQEFDGNSNTYIYNVAGAAALVEWTAYYGGLQVENSTYLGAPIWTSSNVDYYFVDPPQTISTSSGSTTKTILSAFANNEPSQIISMIKDANEQQRLILAHARWERSSTPKLLNWLSYSSQVKNIKDVLLLRLKQNPNEIESLRLIQDIANKSEKIKICNEHKKLASNNPKNGDFYYLDCRCEENETKQDSLFVVGSKKWPSNPWLAFASGYVYAQKEQWTEAKKCFIVAQERGVYSENLEIEIERINRFLDIKKPIEFNLGVKAQSYIEFLQAIENGKEETKGSSMYAHYLLLQGKIEEALQHSQNDTSLTYAILRLAAASKGASPTLIEKAINLPTFQGITTSTVFPMVGLMLKKNLSIEIYRNYINENFQEEAQYIFQFIEHLKNREIENAELCLKKLRPLLKGEAAVLAIVYLGNNVPEKWNTFASKLLLVNEKPYLGF
jgi:Zn-dependent protease with chaperone function